MNQNQVQEAFESITSKMSWWQRFTGSQFARGIALFVGQVMYVVIQAAEKALGEAFLSSATKRSSILASAEDRGYMGRRITPSFGKVEVTNKTKRTLHLPANSHYISQNQLIYLIKEPLTLESGEVRIADAWQFELVEISTPVKTAQQYFTVLLPQDITARASKIDVYVDENGRRRLWDKSFMFRATNADSRVYTEYYRPSEQIGIRFGNGINGKIPPAGSSVTLHVWCTDGDTMLLDGQTLTPIDSVESFADSITVKTKTPISGGAPAETTEETRMGAMYCTPYDDQIVWNSDYRHFIKNHIAGLLWLSVWGEAEEEKSTGKKDVANINCIFISGHKAKQDQDSVEGEIQRLLDSIPDKMNKRFKYRPVDYQPFTITLIAKCPTHNIPDEVRSKLVAALNARFGRDADRFPKTIEELKLDTGAIKEKDIWATLEATGLLIDYDLTCTGRMTPLKHNDLVYLDLSASEIKVTY